MPDIFVSSDTTNVTDYTQEAFSRGLISQFALKFSNNNRHRLSMYRTYESLTAKLEEEGLLDTFMGFAKEKGLEPKDGEIEKSRKLLTRSLYSNIIYQLLGMCEHVKYINLEDSTVLKAVEVLERGEAFPVPEI